MWPEKRHTPPYTQQFRYIVPKEYAGLSLIDLYNTRFPFRSEDYWRSLMGDGSISVNAQGAEPQYLLKEYDVIITRRHDVQEPDVNAGYQVLCEQDGALIIDKPAPLPVHPAGRYYKNCLLSILREKESRTYHTIHRLDTWTTGVLVMATDRERARFLHRQVETKKIKKIYGVIAVGDFGDREFVVEAAVGRVDGAHRGTGPGITEPKDSVTIFTPICKRQGLTLLKAEPVTGRTNQIRVHLNAVGGHVLNDPLYSPGAREDIPFMGLHCRRMSFSLHAGEGARDFVAPWPQHFLQYFDETEIF